MLLTSEDNLLTRGFHPKPVLLRQEQFFPREDTEQCLGIFLVVKTGRRLGRLLLAKNTAKHLTMSRTAPLTQKFPARNVSSAMAEKP